MFQIVAKDILHEGSRYLPSSLLLHGLRGSSRVCRSQLYRYSQNLLEYALVSYTGIVRTFQRMPQSAIQVYIEPSRVCSSQLYRYIQNLLEYAVVSYTGIVITFQSMPQSAIQIQLETFESMQLQSAIHYTGIVQLDISKVCRSQLYRYIQNLLENAVAAIQLQ